MSMIRKDKATGQSQLQPTKGKTQSKNKRSTSYLDHHTSRIARNKVTAEVSEYDEGG